MLATSHTQVPTIHTPVLLRDREATSAPTTASLKEEKEREKEKKKKKDPTPQIPNHHGNRLFLAQAWLLLLLLSPNQHGMWNANPAQRRISGGKREKKKCGGGEWLRESGGADM